MKLIYSSLVFGKLETHVLHDFHSLRIEIPVHFKVLLYTYKGLNEHEPSYISDMSERYMFQESEQRDMAWTWWPKISICYKDIV